MPETRLGEEGGLGLPLGGAMRGLDWAALSKAPEGGM